MVGGKHNKGTHANALLVQGVLANGRVRCPLHGACFSVETGDIEEMPGLDNLQTFPVHVAGDKVVVRASAADLKKTKRMPGYCSRAASNPEVFVVVGAGAAGMMCVETLRKEGFTGRIVLIGKEPHAPYDRTKLSKAMSLTADKILMRPLEWFAQNSVETRFKTEVTQIDVANKTLHLHDGSTLSYTQCFVATGGAPRTLSVPGHNLRNVFCLRVPEEASAILQAVEGKDLVIVGSSFIGMETAAALFQKAKSVQVIGMEKVPFERVLGPEIGAALQQFHETKGKIVFHMQRVVSELKATADGAVAAVVLDNGVTLDAGIVVMGAGVIPATSMFREGVTKDRDQSIVVDAFLCAAPSLYVGGDIARYTYHYTGASVRIEHYGMAMYHGKVAALNMLGRATACESIPFFWTQQYGKSLRYCGFAHKYDNVIVDGDLTKPKFVVFFCLEGKVLACASMDRDPAVSLVAELMHNNAMPDANSILAEIKSVGRVTLGGLLKE